MTLSRYRSSELLHRRNLTLDLLTHCTLQVAENKKDRAFLLCQVVVASAARRGQSCSKLYATMRGVSVSLYLAEHPFEILQFIALASLDEANAALGEANMASRLDCDSGLAISSDDALSQTFGCSVLPAGNNGLAEN
jgi:hypothetical protein